jgi:lipopolysaccharide transport system ATP-binding protein
MRFLNRFRLHGTLLFVSHDSGAIVKLCDRALWLDQGVVRGFGDAKEMCRLYLAAQAEEAADDRGRFQISNRTEPPVVQAMPESPPDSATNRSGVLDFDPEEDWEESGAGAIESVALLTTDGLTVHVAKGGEEIELQITCRARRRIGHPVVAFVWRDRLGQILFSDDTLVSYGDSLNVEEGSTFIVSFTFRLPYLSSGPYSIEVFLFESTKSGFIPIVRRRDCLIIYVQSRHIFQQGLVNIGMRSVSLRNLAHDMPWGQHSSTSNEVMRINETKSGSVISDGIAKLA